MAMSWLKRFGEAVKLGATVIPVAGPIISALIPGTKDDNVIIQATDKLADIGEIIKQAEVFGAALNLTGEDKLKGAIPSISQVILRSAIMSGETPGDRAMYDAGVAEVTSGLVKIMNSRAE